MKIDIRILAVVTCFMLLGASGVMIIRNADAIKSSSVIIETIPGRGIPTAGRVVTGLKLKISSNGLSFILPDCDATMWQDNLFIHLYTDGVRSRSSDSFVNMDFNLKDEVNKISKEKRGESCIITKSFSNFTVKAVGVGQFTAPNGKCCDITWSRFYVFDSSFNQK